MTPQQIRCEFHDQNLRAIMAHLEKIDEKLGSIMVRMGQHETKIRLGGWIAGGLSTCIFGLVFTVILKLAGLG